MEERKLDLYEYAVSEGEGTLIDYGIGEWSDVVAVFDEETANGMTVIVAPCDDCCMTGV